MTKTSEPILANESSLTTATETWLSVVQTYNECSETLSLRLRPLGLSLLEHEVLMNLLRSDGSTQKQLSERCFSAKSGISMLVSRFENEGIIRRRRSETDQRAWLLSLTAKGQTIAKQAFAVQAEIVSVMAAPFTDAELSSVRARMEDAALRLKDLRKDGAAIA